MRQRVLYMYGGWDGVRPPRDGVAAPTTHLPRACALRTVLPVLPWIPVVFIAGVVFAVVGNSAETIASAGLLVLLAVVLHNLLGYALGYGLGRLTRQGECVSRTVSVEVGMQNSGLAAGLAAQYLAPASALPGAVFSVWHNISGAFLAMLFRRMDARRKS